MLTGLPATRTGVRHRMTTDKNGDKSTKARIITFKCKFCGETRPLDEMVMLPGFFPPIAACRDCEKAIRQMRDRSPSPD